MKNIKSIISILVMIIIVIILSISNIFISLRTKNCSYEINTDLYQENISLAISRYKTMKITREYTFKNMEILEIEKQALESNGYVVKVKNLTIIATKKEDINNYNDAVNTYQELGFICK